MSNKITLALFTLAVFILAGCAKDEAPTPDALQIQNPEIPADIQASVDEALAELEADYNNPPSTGEVGSRASVYVPAGSVDALTDAIEDAGWGGKVVLRSGDHWESETVMIKHTVRIIGENGAKLYLNTLPADATDGDGQILTEPGIHVKNANLVRIENIEFLPTGPSGSMALFLEGGRIARIQGNKFTNFKYPVWLSDLSNATGIYDNEFYGGGGITVWGITLESGKSVKVKGNYFQDCVVGLFLSDERAIASDNVAVNGSIGILLCTVQGTIVMPDGEVLQKAISCTQARVIKNNCHDNYWNYLVIDGANHNFLFRNEAANAGLYDVELAGPTARFGTPSPTSSNNFVVNPNNNIITKDCGVNNTVLAGTMVNNEEDPCF
jgi:nitrogen fixation protein